MLFTLLFLLQATQVTRFRLAGAEEGGSVKFSREGGERWEGERCFYF